MNDSTWRDVDRYLEAALLPEDPVLTATLARNAEAGLPAIDVSPSQGRFLHLLALIAGARRILEIGTLGGYSTIELARALPALGTLVTCEYSPDHAAVARANLEDAGLADRVEIRIGPALDTLPTLDGPFDLVFVDADKQNNAAYLDHAIRLGRPGTVIVIDNVVRGGQVLAGGDPQTDGTRRMFAALETEDRVEATALQTVGVKGHDGFVLARVR
jgi:predicted O-methyltransferase YrrM